MVAGSAWVDRYAGAVRPWSRRRSVAWWLVVAAGVFGVGLIAGKGGNPLIDLKVYRAGGLSWIRGLPLYATQFPKPLAGPDLPFTYPPFAAVVFSVFGVVGYHVAAALLVVIGLGALTWVIVLVWRERREAWGLPALTARGVVMMTLAVVVVEPVCSTFLHGQINLLLMGLVAADTLGPRTRVPRGALTGIAAAIKLTPAVFLIYFIARRQWRETGTAAAAFVGATLLSFLVARQDSETYWTTTVFDPARIGDLGYAANQSLRGAIHRLGMGAKPEVHVWMLASAIVVLLAYRAARRCVLANNLTCAVVVVAACQLLISPVSWSHHWVWVAPALPALVVRVVRTGSRIRIGGAAALIAVFLMGPLLLLPVDHGREMQWDWWQNVIGDLYMFVTVSFVAWVALARRGKASEVPHPHLVQPQLASA
ncbi:glycosyltransferase 87 family protein [Catenulispora yoronensis]|uniref:Glycosyltransferase 87 family protein n=1 Tax=Catenulispora yoronensis TaxID=450799 RepID=A0ABN2VAC6_9ACTN